MLNMREYARYVTLGAHEENAIGSEKKGRMNFSALRASLALREKLARNGARRARKQRDIP
jgi:hypothetical protein